MATAEVVAVGLARQGEGAEHGHRVGVVERERRDRLGGACGSRTTSHGSTRVASGADITMEGMPRSRRVATPRSPRRLARDRHGRGMRSAVTGPHLEPIRTRLDEFDFTVATTAAYLRGLWPELEGVVFEVAQGPAEAIHGDHVDRWKVVHDERRITFYRLPIVRFLRLQEGEDREEKLLVESCVFRAVAELLDKDPWELAPGRYRHL